MLHVCFVCLGNTCRSPMAEAVLRQRVREAGAGDRIAVASAGLSDSHVGEPPHRFTQAVLGRRGVPLAHVCRRLEPADVERSDLIVAMDHEGVAAVERLPGAAGKVRLLREWDPEAAGDLVLPDPWGEPVAAYEEAFEVIDRSCRVLLAELLRIGS